MLRWFKYVNIDDIQDVHLDGYFLCELEVALEGAEVLAKKIESRYHLDLAIANSSMC